ncbi:EpsG family protein [Gelidibacter mesophilus]|uniref:EpsG family protein n=1 Tax=Gelidibacter mesophilus TaxID=169050 RepID=UPI000417617A|nr:EpsG family protein [Gelidibacter mesophilus]
MNSASQKILNNKGVLFLLFWISPIIPFLYAIKNFTNRNYRFLILMFAFLFGYSFIPHANSDTERYIEYYDYVKHFSLNDYVQEISSIYTTEARFKDVYLVTLMFLVSTFGASFKILMGVQAVLYFSFFIGILNLILDQVRHVDYKNYIVFLLGCVFIYSLSAGVNGIRFPTAFMVFIYFSLKYSFNSRWIYVLLAGLSCLIHIALIQAFLGLLLFFALNKINNTYFKFLIVIVFALVLYNLNIQETSQILNNEVISEKVEDYTNQDYIEEREQHTQNWNWYIQFNQYSNYYFLMILFFLSMLKLKSNLVVNRLALIVMIFLIISLYNEIYFDSISNRYRQFFEFFALVYLVVLFAFTRENRYKKVGRKIYAIILLISILIQFRSLSYNLDIIRLTISPAINLMEFEGVNIYNLF